MATAPTNARPTPERIFNTLNAYQQTVALRAAIELDVFTVIADGATDVASIATKTGAAERGIQTLCNYLTIIGFLTKENGRFALTRESNVFLSKRSPAYMGAIAEFLAGDHLMKKFSSLTEAVKKGGSAAGHGDNQEPNDEMWVTFARSMAPLTTPSAMYIAQLTGMPQGKACQILDIAAGHGMYGITMAKNNPNAQVTACGLAQRAGSGEGKCADCRRRRSIQDSAGQRVRYRPGDGIRFCFVDQYLSPLRSPHLRTIDAARVTPR